MHRVNDSTVVSATGDYADFQFIERRLDLMS